MEKTFFNQIAQLDFTGVLQLNISKGADNNLIVSVLLNNEACGGKAKNLIPPMTFNGSPKDLDDGFFEQINAPIQTVSGLMVDMENYLKQVEEAKKQSAMEKQITDKANKEKEAKDKKYKDAMEKVAELEKAGKFREAWTKLPEIALYPEKADELRKKKTELSSQFQQNSLFGLLEEPKAQQPIVQKENGNEEFPNDFQSTESEKEELTF